MARNTKDSFYVAKFFPLLLAIATFFLGVATEHLIGDLSSGSFLAAVADDAVVSIIVGGMVLFYDRRRRRYLALRLNIIGEMNQQLRNALRVILMAMLQQGDEKVESRMRESLLHIDWALRQVLPSEADNDSVFHRYPTRGRSSGLSKDQFCGSIEALAPLPAAPPGSVSQCAREVGSLDREGNEPVTHAVIQVFASETGELLARMTSVHLGHVGSLVSSFVDCARATRSCIDVHLEIRSGRFRIVSALVPSATNGPTV